MNVAKKVRNQTILYFPLHLTSASALAGKTRKHVNRIFSLNVVLLLPEFNQLLLDFFNFVELHLIFTLL